MSLEIQPENADPPIFGRVLLIRAALVPVAVGVCYLHDWAELRNLTIIALVNFSTFLGLPLHRIGFDLIELGDFQSQVVVSCTAIDAFFGAIPLLWFSSKGAIENSVRLGLIFVAVFILNILRLEIGFVGLHIGVPWWLGHECLSGVAYFCLLVFIVRQRAWHATRVADDAAPSIGRAPLSGAASRP